MKESNWNVETRRLGSPLTDAAAGQRLDEYLARMFPFFSRAGWQREIKRGAVLINDQPITKPAQRLKLGDELRRSHPLDEEPDVDIRLTLLWTDGHLAAVYKPPGLPMHESGYYRRRTVAGVLPQLLGPEWTAVHRLDRETSGIVLCAKKSHLRSRLTDMWTNRQVKKTYLAVLNGSPALDDWTVREQIKADRYERTNRATVAVDGQEAVTLFKTLARGQTMSLVKASPITGRTNQIRVHAAHVGLPVVGDKVYGSNKDILELYRKEGNSPRVQQMAGFPRHALHAWKLSFRHPISGSEIVVENPLPPDLVLLLQQQLIDLETILL